VSEPKVEATIARGATVWRFVVERWDHIEIPPRVMSGTVTAAGESRCAVRWEGHQSAQQWTRRELERIAYPTREAALYGAMSALVDIQATAEERARQARQARAAVREMIEQVGTC
jgi:hypothetical protein